MANNTLRIALNAATFPFIYRDAQRATLLTGLDQSIAYTPQFGTLESADWNKPQLLYCENVMPVARGFISTHLNEVIGKFGVDELRFDQAIIVRDKSENNTLVAPAGGQNFVYNPNTGVWATSLPFTATGRLVTRAYTQGRSFILYEKEKLFEYDGTTGVLVDRTASIVFPAGFGITDIRGVGGASNYLLLFTDIDLLWSSPSDPLNFNSALNNGSGRQTPQDVRGRISCILPVSGGAVIYTVRNAVAATFTNNATAPFIFRGISNSGGVASYEQVAYDADEKYQYVWGSGGLQKVSLQIAEGVFAEVTDFLTSAIYEHYDWTTHKVISENLGSYLSVKMTYISQRFLIISYGTNVGSFTYALIFDTVLARWGKVKVGHVDCFSFPYPNLTGDLLYSQLNTDYAAIDSQTYTGLGIGILSTSPPKKSIAFLQQDGTVSVLSIDYNLRQQKGVALVGQIQHSREVMTTLHEVELEGVQAGSNPKLYDLVSLNGKTVDRVVEYHSYETAEEYRRHLGREVGKNHTLSLEGAFQLTGLVVRVAKHGRT